MIRKLDEYIRVHTIVAFRFSGVRARAEARESHPQERTGVGPGDCSERRKQSRVCGTSHSAPSQWHSGSARVSRALSMRMGMARPLDFLRATPRAPFLKCQYKHADCTLSCLPSPRMTIFNSTTIELRIRRLVFWGVVFDLFVVVHILCNFIKKISECFCLANTSKNSQVVD